MGTSLSDVEKSKARFLLGLPNYDRSTTNNMTTRRIDAEAPVKLDPKTFQILVCVDGKWITLNQYILKYID